MMYLKYPKRITISFTPEVYDFLRRQSEDRMESMATLVREYTDYFYDITQRNNGLVGPENNQ